MNKIYEKINYEYLTYVLIVVFLLLGYLFYMDIVFDKEIVIDKLYFETFIEDIDNSHGYNLKRKISQHHFPHNKSLFCWVFTSTIHHLDRVPVVNKTWLPRCDYGVFFTNSPMNDTTIPHAPIWTNLKNTYLNSHNKTMVAWPYVYKNVSSEYDWYYKGEDDGYVIVENLRVFLQQYNPDEPHYFGAWIKPYVPKGYNSGGGYVLSRGALKLLVEAMEKTENFCPKADYEDLGIGVCLAKLGITPEATSDSNGHHRFFPYSFQEVVRGFAEGWYEEPILKGTEAFHPELIQLHHIFPQEMLLMDTMLYRIRVKGLDK